MQRNALRKELVPSQAAVGEQMVLVGFEIGRGYALLQATLCPNTKLEVSSLRRAAFRRPLPGSRTGQ